MRSTGQSTKSSTRGFVFGSILMPLVFGALAFLRVLGDSHTQAIRSLDMIRLIGVGFCWGIAFGGLLWLITQKRWQQERD